MALGYDAGASGSIYGIWHMSLSISHLAHGSCLVSMHYTHTPNVLILQICDAYAINDLRVLVCVCVCARARVSVCVCVCVCVWL